MKEVVASIEYHPENAPAVWIVRVKNGPIFAYQSVEGAAGKLTDPFFNNLLDRHEWQPAKPAGASK